MLLRVFMDVDKNASALVCYILMPLPLSWLVGRQILSCRRDRYGNSEKIQNYFHLYIYIYTQSSSHSKSGVTNFNLLDGQLFYCGVQFWTQVDSSVGQTRATGRQLMIRILSNLICIRKNRNMYELWIFRFKCLRCKYSIIWHAIVNIFTLSFSLQSLLFSWQHVQTVRLFWVLFVDIFCDWEDKKKKNSSRNSPDRGLYVQMWG